jgi:hypothetical protein
MFMATWLKPKTVRPTCPEPMWNGVIGIAVSPGPGCPLA